MACQRNPPEGAGQRKDRFAGFACHNREHLSGFMQFRGSPVQMRSPKQKWMGNRERRQQEENTWEKFV